MFFNYNRVNHIYKQVYIQKCLMYVQIQMLCKSVKIQNNQDWCLGQITKL